MCLLNRDRTGESGGIRGGRRIIRKLTFGGQRSLKKGQCGRTEKGPFALPLLWSAQVRCATQKSDECRRRDTRGANGRRGGICTAKHAKGAVTAADGDGATFECGCGCESER
jgi:hypothetical protein